MTERKINSKLTTFSFVIASFSTQPAVLIISLLLIEISSTFGIPVGVSGQLRTLSSIVGVITAILLGAISLRYSSKHIILLGSLLLSISAFTCAIAWDFTLLLLFYSLSGIGVTMITPMVNTLIGEYFPQEKRSKVLGLSAAGTSIAFLILSPLTSYISGIVGWRAVFMTIMLPISILGFIIGLVGIPKISHRKASNVGELFTGYKSVLKERSAVFCLIGTMLSWSSFLGSLTYAISFSRQQFLVPLGWASILLSAMALSKTAGHLTIGALILRYGRKSVVVASTLSMSVFIVGYLLSPNIWISMMLSFVSCTLAGYMHSSIDSHNLEQVPKYRSSMMSLSSAFYTMGGVLGAGIGGFTVILGGYSSLAFILGLFGISSSLFFLLLTKDKRE